MAARILVVEDNTANLELMTYLLNAFGYVTSAARNGEDGLRIALRERPDLILCDVQMPGMDGYAVAQRAKGDPALRNIPLVAVTALAMVGDRDKTLAKGFDGYLAKPIDPETFVQEVESFLAPRLRSNVKLAASQASPSPQPSPPRPDPNGRTILVLDNLQANLDLARAIFAYAGYAVVTASDVKAALALARETPPDLIMSDVCMPVSSGFDFITLVKADPRLRDLPFVFLTSTAMNDEERTKGLALGATRYLFRPVEPRKLLDEVEACLQERSGA